MYISNATYKGNVRAKIDLPEIPNFKLLCQTCVTYTKDSSWLKKITKSSCRTKLVGVYSTCNLRRSVSGQVISHQLKLTIRQTYSKLYDWSDELDVSYGWIFRTDWTLLRHMLNGKRTNLLSTEASLYY